MPQTKTTYSEADMVRAREVKQADSSRRIRTVSLVSQAVASCDLVLAAVKEARR